MRSPILVATKKWRGWSTRQRGLVMVGAAGLCLMLASTANRAPKAPTKGTSVFAPVEYQAQYPVAHETGHMAAIDENDLKQLQAAEAETREAARKELARNDDLRIATGGPLIAHTAELAVVTKEFGRSRTSLEEILERHRGYAAKLRMVGQKSGSVLSATLRVPSTELTGTVSELKALGDVEREEQAADEITQQRADLEARLTNAQNTLRRLEELLKKQSYPDGNVRELQRQIANASAEVARLQAERQSSEQKVVFANVYFTMREELATPSESLGAELKSAAAAGFGEAAASLSALLLFLIGRGPVVLLWCVILWLPVRWIWKRLSIQQSAAVQGA